MSESIQQSQILPPKSLHAHIPSLQRWFSTVLLDCCAMVKGQSGLLLRMVEQEAVGKESIEAVGLTPG